MLKRLISGEKFCIVYPNCYECVMAHIFKHVNVVARAQVSVVDASVGSRILVAGV